MSTQVSLVFSSLHQDLDINRSRHRSRVQGSRLGMNVEKETEERKKIVEIMNHIYVWGMDIWF